MESRYSRATGKTERSLQEPASEGEILVGPLALSGSKHTRIWPHAAESRASPGPRACDGDSHIGVRSSVIAK